MRRLSVFNHVSLDGYFVDLHGDMSWAHKSDPEWLAFVEQNAGGGGELVFGRVTYDLMAGYWPTPAAAENDPVVAERMNALPKVVFSRSLKDATWSNTRILSGDPAAEMVQLKQAPSGLRGAKPHNPVALNGALADVGTNPIGSVRHEPSTMRRLELLSRLQQADVAFLYQVVNGNAPPSVRCCPRRAFAS